MVTRVRSFDDVRRIVADGALSPKAQAAFIAGAARKIIADARVQNARVLGTSPKSTTFVDGREGAALESIRVPKGTILVEFELVSDAVSWTMGELRRVAPVLTGAFRQSFLLLADGQEVNLAGPLPAATEFALVSDAPYSRKLEGVARRRPESRQAPEGVFQVVAGLAARRFGNTARVTFGYQSLPSGSVGRYAANALAKGRGRGGSIHARRDWLSRQPAIFISPR